MDLLESQRFFDPNAGSLEAYARDKARDLGLDIAPAHLAGVLDNLASLQGHASVVAASLDAAGSPAARVGAS